MRCIRWIYFVEAQPSRLIKIGIAADPWNRVREFQTAHFEVLELLAWMPGSILTEHALHRRFAPAHVRGEWFRPLDELRLFIATEPTMRYAVPPSTWEARAAQ